MITYKNIGHFGRLGNQLFQFASTFGIAKKLGCDVAFPIENITEYNREHFKDNVIRDIVFDVPKCFDIPSNLLKTKSEILTKNEITEPHFHFSEDLFSIPDSTNLNGYYQSYKYFDHVKEDLLGILKFKDTIQESAKLKMHEIPKSYDTVALHVRIGDYAGLQLFHPICGLDYYIKALSKFTDSNNEINKYVLIFSDNIEYCKDIFGKQEGIMYIEGNDQYTDLCMMSLCDHNIIANSSFSWWAAWLNKNPNKTIIAPKKWFGPAYEGVNNTKDLYYPGWEII